MYRLANEWHLPGSVCNDTTGVKIEVEGDRVALDGFLADITRRAPPLAEIETVQVEAGVPVRLAGFRIAPSVAAASAAHFVSPDVATCDDCLRELADPQDRRHGYPFLNCTQCGPRFTIIRRLPYDRPLTSMAGFTMCERCASEYRDPGDRRFHAQPTACPACGPRLQWRDAAGSVLSVQDALVAALAALREGRIVAVKGLGGYHLACDATAEGPVRRLRRRKHRPSKPLAVMVADLDGARELCRVSDAEAELLSSPRRPIVLLEKLHGGLVAQSVAPRNARLGVMLPYTPLHHLLLDHIRRPLVMTSGNVSNEPIVHRDDEAPLVLHGIADFFLTHDRPIETSCDDSVACLIDGGPSLLRRSRGYVPQPVALPLEVGSPLLAVGGHLKNVFCMARHRHAFLSHHVGDLDRGPAFRAFQESIDHYETLFDMRASLVVHDLHPEYLSTKHALELAAERGIQTLAVQHHHAHVAGCAAENGFDEPVIGVAFDGTGHGPDGTVWGGEFLIADLAGYERAARLRPVRLPGGEAAIREPWRVAAAYLWDLGAEGEAHPFIDSLDAVRWRLIRQMLERGFNAPLASSAGRLFDAVAALAGLPRRISYEGEAAVELESCLDAGEKGAYAVEIRCLERPWEVDTRPLIEAVAADAAAGVGAAAISARFHRTLVATVVEVCGRLRDCSGIGVVALSGGVFQNAWLARHLPGALAAEGFRVLVHRRVPCNDGGLAYGQAAVAAAVRRAAIA